MARSYIRKGGYVIDFKVGQSFGEGQGWQQSLVVVTPETVVRWHRAGFRLYWKLISKVRRPVGRRQTPKEVLELIFRMVVENSTWRAPRIHGELLMLGFDVSPANDLSLDETGA